MTVTRQDIRIVAISVVLGPPLGTLIYLTGATLISAFGAFGRFDLSFVALILNYLPMVIIFGYMLGILPALFSAVSYCVIVRRVEDRRRRLGYAFLAGFVPSAVGLGGLILLRSNEVEWLGVLAIGLTGGLTALACAAIVEARSVRSA